MYFVLLNPASTSAAVSRRRIEALKRAVGAAKVEVIETTPKKAEFEAKLTTLAKRFTKESVLVIAAGDGTVSDVINILTSAQAISNDAAHVTLLPFWGGNANDLAHMLSGQPPRNMKAFIDSAKSVSLYPLSITLDSGTKRTIVATNYVSFGASAHAAKHINSDDHRESKFRKIFGLRRLLEIAVSFKHLATSPRYTALIQGDHRRIYEILISNGPRMAKLHFLPVKLDDKVFFLSIINRKNIATVIRNLIKSWVQTVNTSPHNHYKRRSFSFTTIDPVTMQYDGETVSLEADTRVSISIASTPIRLLSTNLGDDA